MLQRLKHRRRLWLALTSAEVLVLLISNLAVRVLPAALTARLDLVLGCGAIAFLLADGFVLWRWQRRVAGEIPGSSTR